MTLVEGLTLTVDGLSALLIPVVLVVLGQWFLRNKERADSARRDADQLGAFLEHLSSESEQRRKLALLALMHMRNAGLFPSILLQSVESIAADDRPVVAAAARLALGRARPRADLTADDRARLFELLLPMKVHLDRSREAFKHWVIPSKPNEEIEAVIRASNLAVLDLLTSRWHLIPADLHEDALQFVRHYDAWLKEYERVRPGGVRDPDVPYVFVGPQGFPFPVAAEQRFLARYAALTDDAAATETGD